MSPFTPGGDGDELFELQLRPQGRPEPWVLERLEQVIREAVELAQTRGGLGEVEDWVSPDPDAPPTSLADAVAQAEDRILEIAEASRPRAAELARPATAGRPGFWRWLWSMCRRMLGRRARWPAEDVRTARIRAADARLRTVVERLNRTGIVVVEADALEETPTPTEP